MRILRTEYKIESGIPVVYLFCRDEAGKREITTDNSLSPYFYIPTNENSSGLKVDPGHYQAVDGTPVSKSVYYFAWRCPENKGCLFSNMGSRYII